MGEGPFLWFDKEFCRQTRQIFAAILDVLQENLTRYDGKRPVKRRCGWDEERPGVFLVNLSEQYGALADISLSLADYSIVLTLSQVEGVEAVEITAGGRRVSTIPARG